MRTTSRPLEAHEFPVPEYIAAVASETPPTIGQRVKVANLVLLTWPNGMGGETAVEAIGEEFGIVDRVEDQGGDIWEVLVHCADGPCKLACEDDYRQVWSKPYKTALSDFALDNENHRAAAERALSEGYTLGKYADPTEGAREGLTTDEAVAIAREDASLIYVVRATSAE